MKKKTLKTKVLAAPRPDPRLVPSGTPAISYALSLLLLAGLVLCAHITNSLPAPGDSLSVLSGNNIAARGAGPARGVSAQVLGNVLAASGPACTLSRDALRGSGGSFTILAHRPDGMVLSWAGASTTAASLCPADTPLLVSPSAYRSLRDWLAASYRH